MPAIITHDTFGQEIYGNLSNLIGSTPSEYEAFLLGNQGPDPLFYSTLLPRLSRYSSLGPLMHNQKTDELLVAFNQALAVLDESEVTTGRAYVLGFLCHYILDSLIHPLVFFHEFRLCDAGQEGLSRKNHCEVHAHIESAFDEMILFTMRDKTIASFDPSKEILRANNKVLNTISKLYLFAAMTVYRIFIPKTMFPSSTKAFRTIQSLFHSPTGTRRNLVGDFEELFRDYSFFRAMSLRDIESKTTPFDNCDCSTWENPFTEKVNTKGFWDIFDEASALAISALPSYATDRFSHQEAQDITKGLDFFGKPQASRDSRS